MEPIEKLVRDGLLLAASRTYGEQYVEPFVRAKYGLREAIGGDHDGVDEEENKYEIKACKVLRSSVNRKGTKSLLERVLYETTNVATLRSVPFLEAQTASYDANVQNVKRDHFDFLIYVLLFADSAKIFRVATNLIASRDFRGWSDKHGRYDELGKSGQFNVTKTTIQWHLDNYLIDTVSYHEMAGIFLQLSDDN